MKEHELEKIGIYKVAPKIYPNKYFIPLVGERNLYEPISIEEIFKIIHDYGFEDGKEKGKELKIKEIKSVLDIE